jgi:hypothetical protein
MDAAQWEGEAGAKAARVSELEGEVAAAQQELATQVASLKVREVLWCGVFAQQWPCEALARASQAASEWRSVRCTTPPVLLNPLQTHLQADIASAEARGDSVAQQLAASEARLTSQAAELEGLQQQLSGVRADLDKATAALADKDSKVGWLCV